MRGFLLRRLLAACATLLVISMLTFGLFFVIPADPAQLQCGPLCGPREIADVSQRLGLDQPVYVQYLDYLRGIVAGRTLGSGQTAVYCSAPCLGFSFQNYQPVTPMIREALPVTVSIALGGAVLWIGLGVGLGLVCAWFRGTWLDRLITAAGLVTVSIQIFFVGLMLLLVFVYRLHWLSQPAYVSPFADPWRWSSGMLLPWITLAITHSALYTRLTRAQMIDTLSKDFVRAALAKGLSLPKVYMKHALRASLTPLLTVTGIQVGAALGGVAVIERLFGMPGMGLLGVQATVQLDLPVVMGVVLVAAFFVVIANLVVDVLYAVIDPRVVIE